MAKQSQRSMSLENDGLLRVGWITLHPSSTFSVHFDLNEARSWQNAVYAFRIGDEVVKIGVAAIWFNECTSGERTFRGHWQANFARAAQTRGRYMSGSGN